MKPNRCSPIARLHFLQDCGVGIGKAALPALIAENAMRSAAAQSQAPFGLTPKKPHFEPKATAVIHLFMAGAPSHIDLFDYKPALVKYAGKPIPPEVIKGQ